MVKNKIYDKYKDSGIEWLGEIPEQWEVHKLKHIATVRPSNVDKKTIEGEHPVKLCNYTDVYYNERITCEIDFMNATASQDEILRFTLEQGDVLITKDSEAWDDIAVSAYVADTLKNTLCGYHLAHIRPDAILLDGNYLCRAFSSFAIRDQFRVAANGITRFGLSVNSICSSVFPVPPLPEQRTIADFLDRRTGQIDDLIAKKERVIELLSEKRTAIISHAVTKGLNPDAKMKDSGIDWLGEIPEHWEVKRLRHIIKDTLVNGLFKKKEHFGSGVSLINVFDIYRDNFLVDTDSLERVEANKTEIEKYAVKSGDIFFVRSSLKLEGVGKSVCMLDVAEPTVFECHVVRARPDTDQILPVFLINYLNSTITMDRLISLANMVTMTTLDQIKIKDIEVAVPPILEQVAIAKYLKQEYLKTDTLVSKVTEVIEKLKEYRTALISAAVTGKIDVREEGGKQ